MTTQFAYPDLFKPSEEQVVEGIDCTWCGAEIGEMCRRRDRSHDARAHAGRWFDYWNITHRAFEHHIVARAPWRAVDPDE